jgi:acyl-CoA synthetase (AMP-forming)/AMP-acid ligase II
MNARATQSWTSQPSRSRLLGAGDTWHRVRRGRAPWPGIDPKETLKDEIKAHVAKKIGALARPDDVIYAAELPKTRSGKIMRRLLRDVAEGRALGDTTTLADPAVVADLTQKYEED